MAQVDKNTFNAQFNNSGGGYFPTNNTQDIASSNLRTQALTLKDSVFFLIDDAYSGAKGVAPGINTIAGLKAIGTVSLSATGLYVLFRDTGSANALRVYELVIGTDAESSPTIIRPSDYAASTNEKVWKLAVISGTAGTAVIPEWNWAANSNTPPVATSKGQTWWTEDDYDVGGFLIPAGVYITAKIAGASVIDPDPSVSEYLIK